MCKTSVLPGCCLPAERFARWFAELAPRTHLPAAPAHDMPPIFYSNSSPSVNQPLPRSAAVDKQTSAVTLLHFTPI